MLLNMSLFRSDSVIINDDMKFFLGPLESWGPQARSYPLDNLFISRLVRSNFLDVEPITLALTLQKPIIADGIIYKRIG